MFGGICALLTIVYIASVNDTIIQASKIFVYCSKCPLYSSHYITGHEARCHGVQQGEGAAPVTVPSLVYR